MLFLEHDHDKEYGHRGLGIRTWVTSVMFFPCSSKTDFKTGSIVVFFCHGKGRSVGFVVLEA
jgi:hypothetical protein